MSRLPIVNPNRFYENKEIDLVSLLPNNFKETEIETFMMIFEKYLNEMYAGATKYVPPENLESILYTKDLIWTDGYQYVTAPYGSLLSYFKTGDYIRRNNESKYYVISEMIDDSTIRLNELYKREIPPAYFKSAFWSDFSIKPVQEFWNPLSEGDVNPIGMDDTIYNGNAYFVDSANNRLVCDQAIDSDESIPAFSTIATQIVGDYEFEFGFERSNLSQHRNTKFGFEINSTDKNYSFFYENGVFNMSVVDGVTQHVSGYIVVDTDEDSWSVKVIRKRDTGKVSVNVSSLKNKAGTVPYTFTSGVGFFNRFEYEMNAIESFNDAITLKLINGERQMWNYMYFEADSGFPGEVDSLDLQSSSRELPESMTVYPQPFGRSYQSDGTDIYQFYENDGNLRIRNLEATISFSATDFRKSLNTISVLEKIRRLTELHDPDLIDLEYIQHYTDYMGYDVDINRETLGIFLKQNEPDWDQFSDAEKQKLEDDYLRFAITNLPTWYKIKTTDNAITTMLYSFGLITELHYYFCTKYGDKSTWISQVQGSVNELTKEHFQTPHFGLLVNLEDSQNDFLRNPERMEAIVNAINSVKPINTVFHSFGVFFRRNIENIFVSMAMYSNEYFYLR